MLEHREYKSFIQIRRQAFGKNFTTSTMTDTHKTTQWQLRTIWWQRKPIDTQKTYSINIYLLGIREWKNEIYHKANSAKDEKRTEKNELVERIWSFSLIKVFYIKRKTQANTKITFCLTAKNSSVVLVIFFRPLH